MNTRDRDQLPATLPWTFDTTSVWHIVLRGAFALNALLLAGLLLKLLLQEWREALGVAVIEAAVAGFTTVFLRSQEGSRGTFFQDRVEVDSNSVLGAPLPGPRGTYMLSCFESIRVEFYPGNVYLDPGVRSRSSDLIWLSGAANNPKILLARTEHGAGHGIAQQLAALLNLPIQDIGAPLTIRL